LLLAIALFSCAGKKAKTSIDNSATICFNGLYVSKKMDNENAGDDYRSFLKFYKNGTVISVSSSGTPEEVSRWFKQGHQMVSEGSISLMKTELVLR